jgi:hypothetical protein
MPLDPLIAELVDAGDIEKIPAEYMNGAVEMIEQMIK